MALPSSCPVHFESDVRSHDSLGETGRQERLIECNRAGCTTMSNSLSWVCCEEVLPTEPCRFCDEPSRNWLFENKEHHSE